MKDNKYDVIVVGAGIAGATAGKTVAEYGLNVLIMEQRPFQKIGIPVRCAEGVSEQIHKYVKMKPKYISQDIEGFKIYSPNGTKICVAGEGHILDRSVFDKGLIQTAIDAGCDIAEKTRMTKLKRVNGEITITAIHSKQERFFTAPVIIGADGMASETAKQAGIQTKLQPFDIMTCSQVFLKSNKKLENSDFAECYIGNQVAPTGYIWIFPKSDHTANVGIGISAEMSKQPNVYIFDYLRKFIKRKFANQEIKTSRKIFSRVPIAPINNHSTDNILLVGNAGCLVNPIDGGGILAAIKSGIIAGEEAYYAILSQDVSTNGFARYEHRIRENINATNMRLYYLKNIFQKLNDKQFNELAYSLEGIKLTGLTTLELMKIIAQKNLGMFTKLALPKFF